MQWSALLAAGLALPGKALAALRLDDGKPLTAAMGITKKRSVRLAHLTDFHIQPEKGAFDGVTQCLGHLAQQKDKPEFIISGGDLVFDSLGTTDERTKIQWDLYKKVFKDHCNLPVEHCIGNHDCWGWNKKNSKTTGDEPNWGKKRYLEMIGYPKTYHSFDRGGWKFIQLDSIFPHDTSYIGKLDPEQMTWLKDELSKSDAKKPICIVSHIPILSMCAVNSHVSTKGDEFKMGGGAMHLDGAELHTLFKEHPNVKACLSGHIHLLDKVEMDGITYICGGAVCGSWWSGKKDRSDEGYNLIDLYDDGSIGHEYVTYGWKARD